MQVTTPVIFLIAFITSMGNKFLEKIAGTASQID